MDIMDIGPMTLGYGIFVVETQRPMSSVPNSMFEIRGPNLEARDVSRTSTIFAASRGLASHGEWVGIGKQVDSGWMNGHMKL